MQFKEILSISGAPGLFKYIAQGKDGIIVESLTDKRRTMVSGTAKVSSLGDIAIYTHTEEVSLADVFKTIYEKKGKQTNLTSKSSEDELHNLMAEVLPEYDRERVHTSDLKKMITWYNLLTAAGMTQFEIETNAQGEDNDALSTTSVKGVDAISKKQAALNAKPKAGAPKTKVSTPKSTTNRKAQ